LVGKNMPEVFENQPKVTVRIIFPISNYLDYS